MAASPEVKAVTLHRGGVDPREVAPIGDSPIAHSVAHRMGSIETPRARRRLASDLRWRIRLADGTTRPSPGYIRASVLPPLGRSERRILVEDRFTLMAMIERLEEGPVDPQGLIILRRIVTTPPSLGVEADMKAGEELHRQLQAASVLITGTHRS